MSKKPDGGPAFTQTGISERDYFAARAMEAFIQKWDWPEFMATSLAERTATMAYQIADAMLNEKDK